MKKGLFDFYAELPPIAKIILLLAIIALIIFIYIKVSKSIKKGKANQVFNQDYTALTSQGQKASYPATTYTNLADKIESAGAGFAFGLGTDEEAIYDVFRQLKNDLDVVLLGKAFGARTAPDCYFNCPSLGLGGWLGNEMSGEAIKEINTILQSNGVSTKF